MLVATVHIRLQVDSGQESRVRSGALWAPNRPRSAFGRGCVESLGAGCFGLPGLAVTSSSRSRGTRPADTRDDGPRACSAGLIGNAGMIGISRP